MQFSFTFWWEEALSLHLPQRSSTLLFPSCAGSHEGFPYSFSLMATSLWNIISWWLARNSPFLHEQRSLWILVTTSSIFCAHWSSIHNSALLKSSHRPLAQHASCQKTPPTATHIRWPFFLLSLHDVHWFFICMHWWPSFNVEASFSPMPHRILPF